jgi:hypothetical protein
MRKAMEAPIEKKEGLEKSNIKENQFDSYMNFKSNLTGGSKNAMSIISSNSLNPRIKPPKQSRHMIPHIMKRNKMKSTDMASMIDEHHEANNVKLEATKEECK